MFKWVIKASAELYRLKAKSWQMTGSGCTMKGTDRHVLGYLWTLQGVIAATALPRQRLLLPNHQHQIQQVQMITIPAGSASTAQGAGSDHCLPRNPMQRSFICLTRGQKTHQAGRMIPTVPAMDISLPLLLLNGLGHSCSMVEPASTMVKNRLEENYCHHLVLNGTEAQPWSSTSCADAVFHEWCFRFHSSRFGCFKNAQREPDFQEKPLAPILWKLRLCCVSSWELNPTHPSW